MICRICVVKLIIISGDGRGARDRRPQQWNRKACADKVRMRHAQFEEVFFSPLQKRLREAPGRGSPQRPHGSSLSSWTRRPPPGWAATSNGTERRSPAWDLSRHRTVRYSTASIEPQRGFGVRGCAAGRNRIAGGAESSLFDDLHLWFSANQQESPPWGKVGVYRRGSETRSTPYRASGSRSRACALSRYGVVWYTSVSKDGQREFGLRG